MELHDYQKYAVRFIEEHPIAALFLDMGLGKTITTLTAIHNLMFDLFAVRKVLIIAPLRVARDTWSAEIEKWEHLKPLRYSVAVGTEEERIAAIKAEADIYIINRENLYGQNFVCWIWGSGSADSSGSTGMPTSSQTSKTAISCIPTSPCPMQSSRFMRKSLTSRFR